MSAPNVPQLDDVHVAAIDLASEFDRQFKEDHPDADWLVRPAVAHEFCLPGEPCSSFELVKVSFIADGVRTRQPVHFTDLGERSSWVH